MRAAVYCRISNDPSGTGLGVARQRDDCLALLQRRGWTSAGIYTDNDLSAYSGAPRPAYRRLCDDIAAGRIDAVVTWADDRLHRHPRELEDWIDLVEAHRVEVATVTSGTYDLTTPEGRAMARVVGAMARQESERKSVRSARKQRELAEQGRTSGGGTRPFGYLDDRTRLHPTEAPLIREAADRLLAGESMRSVLADWTARDIPTVTGKPWRTQTFRTMMLSGRIAGLRYHRGVLVGPAVWEPIITETEHRQLRSRFAGRTDSHVRVNALVGLLHCGRCESRMIAHRSSSKKRQYRCPTDPPGIACGGVSSLADPLEQEVLDRIVVAFDGGGLDRILTMRARETPDRDMLARRLAEDEAALQQLASDHYVDRVIGRTEFLTARDRIQQRADTTRAELAALSSSTFLATVDPNETVLRRDWQANGVEWRQSLVGAVAHRIHLAPAVRGRNFFDPSRVRVDWIA
jgi:site-specific DNA recombinase